MPLAVPAPITWIVGQDVTASQLNTNLRDGLNYTNNPPIATLTQMTAQSINSAAATAIALDTTVLDSYNGHSNTTNNSRYVGQEPGFYLVSGMVCFAANATADRKAQIYKNGSAIGGAQGQGPASNASGDGTSICTPTFEIYLNGAGDYIELYGTQNSGGALQTSPNTSNICSLTIWWGHS